MTVGRRFGLKLLPSGEGRVAVAEAQVRGRRAGSGPGLAVRTKGAAPWSSGELEIPEGGFWPAPEIPQPNIYPMEWRVKLQKLAAIYQKSKLTLWNPAELPWDGLRAGRGLHLRAASRHHVLVRGAGQLRRLRAWPSSLAPPSGRSSSTRKI